MMPAVVLRSGTALALAVVAVAGCAIARGGPSPALVETTGRAPRPGVVAWAPDGRRLALVGGGWIAILDLPGGARRTIPAPGVLAIDWAPARELLVVERDAAGGRVVALDPETGASRALGADRAIVGARWLHGGPEWLAVAGDRQAMSFGTNVELRMLATGEGAPRVLHAWTGTLPTRDPDVDLTLGWTAARPNPVDHGIVVPEFRKPPMYAPYLELVQLDPFDGGRVELARAELGLWSADASWSPDGRRLAVAGADGRLRVLEPGGELRIARGPVRGLHPSFSPREEVVFLGGWLATPDGEPIRELLPRAAGALGVWSPDGARLAVLEGGRLFVFDRVTSAAAPPERARLSEALWELGSLRREGLLEERPYRERRDRLRREAREVTR
jgi:hypothetical protein